MLVKLQFVESQIDVVPNGQLAIEAVVAHNSIDAIDKSPYFAILMDVFMDVMDGLEATRAIRAHPSILPQCQPYIIAVTANAMKGDAERCLESGMDSYITKPVTLAALNQEFQRISDLSKSKAQLSLLG
jgi:CheY-like chemotaxis protein